VSDGSQQNPTAHPNDNGGLSVAEAEAIWAVLVEECGAKTDHGFVHHQTNRHVTEWRFIGNLGFGGKFWRNSSRRPDDSWGEHWYVTYYPEDQSAERDAAENAANERLWTLLKQTRHAD
jgi:hypothetical protein